MTVLSTRWRFDNYTKKGEFYIEKKIVQKFVKLCLHSSYEVQNSYQFDEILRFPIKVFLPKLVGYFTQRHLAIFAINFDFASKLYCHFLNEVYGRKSHVFL